VMVSGFNRRGFGRRVAAGAAGALALAAGLPAAAGAQQGVRLLNGAGATFPAVLYSKWAAEYNRLTGVQINYQSIGSGGGIKAHQDMTADFGATDGPMTDQQLRDAKGGSTLHIPMALGAVVPTYNLPQLGNTRLRFSAETLPNIFLGKIKKWNDPAIAADNPGVTLPNEDIIVVHRSDGSGTTYIWVDYLSSVNQEWKDKVGTSTSVNWPTGLGGRGNEGVAGEVRQNRNALGYVELAYAIQNRLGVGIVKNSSGAWIDPNLQSVTAAAAGALETMPDDLRVSIVNPAGETSYPIAGFTWVLAYRQQNDFGKARALADYLHWCITEGQKFCADLFYAPLPDAMLPLTFSKIQAINSRGVQALSPGKELPVKAHVAVRTEDNGDGTATTYYSDGTTETYPLG
jgi:phosphate transport system substrate-binding protein